MIYFLAVGLWLVGMAWHVGVMRQTFAEVRWQYRFPRWTQAWRKIFLAMVVIGIRRIVLFWYFEMGGDPILGPHSLMVIVESALMFYGFTGLGRLWHREMGLVTVPMANIVINEHSVIQSWCAAAESMFGWTAAEAVGQTLMQTVMPPSAWEEHRDGIAQFLAGTLDQDRQLPRTLLAYARRKDGLLIRVEISVSAFLLEGGSWQFHGVVRRLVDL